MRSLTRLVPDAEALLMMEPEVLGAKILFLLRARPGNDSTFHLTNLVAELWHNAHLAGGIAPYPLVLQPEINLAIGEAWAWLIAQGLLISPPYSNIDWVTLSRRARKFEDETEVAIFSVSRMLRRESLHTEMANTVWGAFMRREFDVAVLQAMKTVEVAVRTASGLPNRLIGVDLMRKAFADDGPLADPSSEPGERQARASLFAGVIGSFKNPHSHRDVQLSDPSEALELIMMANHLLRIIESRKIALTSHMGP